MAAAAIIVVAMGHQYWFKHQRDDKDDESKGDEWKGDNQHAIDTVPAFPWEPKASEVTGQHLETENKAQSEIGANRIRKHHSINSADASKQLDFLASMTFANGGIRPPNCPCCY